jgi:hypothetical protein
MVTMDPVASAKIGPVKIERNRLVLAICIRRSAGDFVAGKIQTDRHSFPSLVGVDELPERLFAQDQRALSSVQTSVTGPSGNSNATVTVHAPPSSFTVVEYVPAEFSFGCSPMPACVR